MGESPEVRVSSSCTSQVPSVFGGVGVEMSLNRSADSGAGLEAAKAGAPTQEEPTVHVQRTTGRAGT